MRSMTVEEIKSEPVIVNPRHKAFADEYLRCGSATSAAKAVGYSVKNAGVRGAQTLRNPAVKDYLNYHRLKATESASVDKTTLTRELSHVAFSSIEHYTREEQDGSRSIDYSNATSEQLRAISGVKTKTRTIYDNKGNVVGVEKQSEFKLWDKIRAAELLGKDVGMFKEPEQRVVVDVADRLLAARARLLTARQESDGDAE